MALVTEYNGVNHLNGDSLTTLCGTFSANADKRINDVLTCPKCADMALRAISLSTKAERKLWKEL